MPTGAQLFFPEQAFDANSLKGAGGVFNSLNINLYHYAGLNPIKNIDPDGRVSLSAETKRNIHTFFFGPTTITNPDTGKEMPVQQLTAPDIGGKSGVSAIKNIPKVIKNVGTELHHLLPQAKKFSAFFKKAGLDIEKFKVPLDKALHRLKPGGLHTKEGGNWNKVWEGFMEKNPNAKKGEILNQMKKMINDFGIKDKVKDIMKDL